MSGEQRKSSSKGGEKVLTAEEQQAKINEVRRSIGNFPEKMMAFSSDASVLRYLRAQNWNEKKAAKMLKATLKWRSDYKPGEIRWEDIAREAETGKIYRTDYVDKHGRTVLVMRPSRQNSKSTKGQIKYLVYCMENAILNLPYQEQMVWLIDFEGFNLTHISVKVTRETAHVLQDHYPERLGVAILYNPPKFFEPFYSVRELALYLLSIYLIQVAKPFLEPKTYDEVKFVFSDDLNSQKIMEDLFEIDQLESAFGRKGTAGFNNSKYAERMKEDDRKVPSFWVRANSLLRSASAIMASLDSVALSGSDSSDHEKKEDPISSETEWVEEVPFSTDETPKIFSHNGHEKTLYDLSQWRP